MGAAAPLVTVDGARQTPVVGTDRGHSVSRVVVPILPGQQRVVRAVVVEPVDVAGRLRGAAGAGPADGHPGDVAGRGSCLLVNRAREIMLANPAFGRFRKAAPSIEPENRP